MNRLTITVALLLSLGLLACSTDPSATAYSAAAASPAASAGAGSSAALGARVADVAVTPLGDLNLVHASIPAVLLDAQKGPYVPPAERSCAALAAQVQKLDGALGPDLDAAATPGNPGLIERGGNAAGNAAVGALKGAAEGIVPWRGWVRKLSGAERYSREVAAAIAAGTVRRAFLKGMGQSQSCDWPAAPQREASAG